MLEGVRGAFWAFIGRNLGSNLPAAPPDIWSQVAETAYYFGRSSGLPAGEFTVYKRAGPTELPLSSLKPRLHKDLEDRNAYLNLPRSSRACPLLFIISGLSGVAVGCRFPASPASPVHKRQRDDSQLGDPGHNAIID
jgi:hypothetical protein